MRQEIRNIYQFDELSAEAKEKARGWWRESLSWDEWWQSTYEDAEVVHIQITSFDLDRGEINGRLTIEAHLVADEIMDNHGDSCDTYKTAAAFLAERDKLIDEWPRDEDGEFENAGEMDAQLDDLEEQFRHDILEDYRIMLQRELEYQMRDENVDETIRANEYEFSEDGERI